MRRVAGVLLITIFLNHSSAGQEKNTDAFVRAVCDAIRHNDTASFVKLFITFPQLKSVVFESLVHDHDSTYASKWMADYRNNIDWEEITGALKKTFGTFRNKLISKGATPSELEFVKGTYEEFVLDRFPTQVNLKATIFLKDNKEEYKTRFWTTWLQHQEGWFTFSIDNIYKKDEVINEKDSMITVTDTITVVESQEIPEPPPPPPVSATHKKQSTTKSPAKKTKVKT